MKNKDEALMDKEQLQKKYNNLAGDYRNLLHDIRSIRETLHFWKARSSLKRWPVSKEEITDLLSVIKVP